jgi:hypothetical protein
MGGNNEELITFQLTKKQMDKFVEWKKGKNIKPTSIDGGYTICFTPTTLGDIVEVRCVDGTRLILTDYDEF